MPTGYTSQLEEMKFDVKRWVKESIVRAMGICVMFRDDGTMDEDTLAKRLKKEADVEGYNTKRLRETKERMAEVSDWTDAQWSSEFRKQRDKAKVEHAKYIAERNAKKERHIQAMQQSDALLAKAKATNQPEATVNTLQYACDQLQSAFEFDFRHEPYRDVILDQDAGDYRAAELKRLQRDLTYHADEIAKDSARQFDRAKAYDDLCKFVDSVKL